MATSESLSRYAVFVLMVLLCTGTVQFRPGLSANENADIQRVMGTGCDFDPIAERSSDKQVLDNIADVTSGLVGYWPMDDGSGSIVRDSSGNGNNGWLSTSYRPVWQPLGGRIDGALLFDGTGGHVINEDIGIDVNGLDALTVSAWVRSNNIGTDSGFIIFSDPDLTDNRDMRYDKAGASGSGTNLIKCGITSTGGRQQLESSSNVQVTDWQHLAMTWCSGDVVRLYIDGIEDTPMWVEPATVGTLSGFTKLIVGKGGKDTRNTSWNGLIDEVAVFEQKLTSSQVRRLYVHGATSLMSECDLLLLWELDESSGAVAFDSSGNGYNGTLTTHSTPTWQTGIMGDALMFHGKGTYVDCGNDLVFNMTSRMSVAAWVNISSVPSNWTGIVTKGDDAWRLSTFQRQRKFHFAVTSPATGSHWVHGNIEVPADEWTYVVGTYDGAHIRLYVNALEDTASPVPYTGSIDTSIHDVWIGGNSDRNGREFHGLIDEVAVWNQPLSYLQIAELYNQGLGNLIISPTTYYVDDNAPNDPNPGNPLISDPFEDGSQDHPFDAIQEAINVALDGDTVIVRDGTYTGTGNRDISFLAKAILVRSENGPEDCVINCEGTIEESHISFLFTGGENASSILNGFTIVNGFSDEISGGIYCSGSSPTIMNCTIRYCRTWQMGGAVLCVGSSPSIIGCTITNNRADYGDGGGISCWGQSYPEITNCTITANNSYESGGGISCRLGGQPTISNCTIGNNRPDGIGFLEGEAVIHGIVWIVSNDLTSDGVLEIESGAILDLDKSHISCDITGLGTIRIPLGKELIIDSNAAVDLTDPCVPVAKGTIQCDGLLWVRDDALVSNSNVNVLRAIFADKTVITGNVFRTDPRIPYGQLKLRGESTFIDNDIHAAGDRYMDVHPDFAGVIEDNRVYVTITEGRYSPYPGLFEVRGRDEYCMEPPCDPGIVPVELVPDFDVNSWTLEQLTLVQGARLTLTDRFENLPPYESNEGEEVLYVKYLVLGPNSVLDTGDRRLYCESIDVEPGVLVKNEPLRAYSLHRMQLDSEFEFVTKVTNNNDELYDRIHVERVEGLDPDPTGMMQMRNLPDPDPNSDRVVNARAKALFSSASEPTVLVRFNYLFDIPDANARLMVYLSDVEELMDHNDPNWSDHHIHVGCVFAPPPGLPGSFNSERFGVFRRRVSTIDLNLINGLWIEFELIGPAVIENHEMTTREIGSMNSGSGSVWLDDFWPAIFCDAVCMDVDYDGVPTEGDFLMVIAACGLSVDLEDPSTACVDAFFGTDGFADVFDLVAWDWAESSGHIFCNSYSGVPMAESTGATADEQTLNGLQPIEGLVGSLSDLLIAGKRNKSRLKDGLYVFNGAYQCVGSYVPEPERCNIKLAKDFEGKLYQLNSEKGLMCIDDPNIIIVPRSQVTVASEPRYKQSASVYVGLKGEGNNAVGRPVLDVAFDAKYVYVVPVVVKPDNTSLAPYAAAAKLDVPEDHNLPFQVLQLYYDSSLPGGNRDCNALREIEVDSAGKVYVLNVHKDNEADILWKYDSNGTKLNSLSLSGPGGIADFNDPIGLYVSNTTDLIYLATAQYNRTDINSTIVHGFSKETLAVERSITISGMQHVTSITEEPTTGCLWIAGLKMENIPYWPITGDPPFYYPCLATVPFDSNTAQAVDISDPNNNDYLGVPMSIVWARPTGCGNGADITGDNKVTFADFVAFTSAWRAKLGETGWNPACNISIPADGIIDERDLATLVDHWLDTCTP